MTEERITKDDYNKRKIKMEKIFFASFFVYNLCICEEAIFLAIFYWKPFGNRKV